MKKVLFLKSWGAYNPSERAAFSDEIAARLIGWKVAQAVVDPVVKKSAAEPIDPDLIEASDDVVAKVKRKVKKKASK